MNHMHTATERRDDDFSVIFAQLESDEYTTVIRDSRQISETSETIQMIAQATEDQEAQNVVTFYSN